MARPLKLVPLSAIEEKPMRCPYTNTQDDLELMAAVEQEFARSHPAYRWTVFWRYRHLYRVPVHQAVKAVRKSYSSPSAAMMDRVIPHREPQPDAGRYLDCP